MRAWLRANLWHEFLEAPEVTEELSRRFGRDLHPFPRLTTIMRNSQRKYGAIHTDGPSKIMTMLIYMNENWGQAEGGRLPGGASVKRESNRLFWLARGVTNIDKDLEA
jgi:hypothetical protein